MLKYEFWISSRIHFFISCIISLRAYLLILFPATRPRITPGETLRWEMGLLQTLKGKMAIQVRFQSVLFLNHAFIWFDLSRIDYFLTRLEDPFECVCRIVHKQALLCFEPWIFLSLFACDCVATWFPQTLVISALKSSILKLFLMYGASFLRSITLPLFCI